MFSVKPLKIVKKENKIVCELATNKSEKLMTKVKFLKSLIFREQRGRLESLRNLITFMKPL